MTNALLQMSIAEVPTDGNIMEVGKPLPSVFFGAHDPVTLKGAMVHAGSLTEKHASTTGVVKNYAAPDYVFEVYNKFNEVPMDPSLSIRACALGISTEQFLEYLDPTSKYKEGDHLGSLSALERQYYRYGFIRAKRNLNTPQTEVPLKYIAANTPANNLLLPAYTKGLIFWSKIRDLELDPNLLLASTRMQKEQFIQVLSVDDSNFGNRRLTIITENVQGPSVRLSLKTFTGGFIKHGLSLTFSADFVRYVTLDLFSQALVRAAMKERVAHFIHILEVIMDGYPAYGLEGGVPTTKAISLDPNGIVAEGNISYIAIMTMIYRMRPYKPDHIIMNFKTYLAYVQAKPPANFLEASFLATLSKLHVTNLPNPIVTAHNFTLENPPVLVVPDYALADNIMIFQNVSRSLTRVVLQGSEIDQTQFDVASQTNLRVMFIQDGLSPLPDFHDATQVLSLTL